MATPVIRPLRWESSSIRSRLGPIRSRSASIDSVVRRWARSNTIRSASSTAPATSSGTRSRSRRSPRPPRPAAGGARAPRRSGRSGRRWRSTGCWPGARPASPDRPIASRRPDRRSSSVDGHRVHRLAPLEECHDGGEDVAVSRLVEVAGPSRSPWPPPWRRRTSSIEPEQGLLGFEIVGGHPRSGAGGRAQPAGAERRRRPGPWSSYLAGRGLGNGRRGTWGFPRGKPEVCDPGDNQWMGEKARPEARPNR